MKDTILVEVHFPQFLKIYDMELALFADAEILLEECLRWFKEQHGCEIQKGEHFFCNPRTNEIIKKGKTLSETGIVRGDVLIIF